MMSLVGALAGSTAIPVTWIVAVLDFIGVGLLRPCGFGVKEISANDPFQLCVQLLELRFVLTDPPG